MKLTPQSGQPEGMDSLGAMEPLNNKDYSLTAYLVRRSHLTWQTLRLFMLAQLLEYEVCIPNQPKLCLGMVAFLWMKAAVAKSFQIK